MIKYLSICLCGRPGESFLSSQPPSSDKVLPHCPGWFNTHCVDFAGFELEGSLWFCPLSVYRCALLHWRTPPLFHLTPFPVDSRNEGQGVCVGLGSGPLAYWAHRACWAVQRSATGHCLQLMSRNSFFLRVSFIIF